MPCRANGGDRAKNQATRWGCGVPWGDMEMRGETQSAVFLSKPGSHAVLPPAHQPALVVSSRMHGKAIRIIGIDPGLRRTGWGIIETDGVRLVYVASGIVTSDARGRSRLPPARAVRGPGLGHRRLQARGGGDRGDLRQQECARDVEARPGARHGAAGAGARRGCAIAEYAPNVDQEDGDRRRPWREAARSRRWSASCCRRPRSTARTRRTRWPSPSATPAIARAQPRIGGEPCGAGEEASDMIGKLQGRRRRDGRAHAIIDVGGVGYEVQRCSARTLRAAAGRQQAR